MPTSQNGWPVLTSSAGLDNTPVGAAGVKLAPGVLAGDVATVLHYVARQWDSRIERLIPGTCWGYAFRAIRGQSSGYSNHASGTAVDLMAPSHPLGKKGTFSAAQRRELAEIAEECTVDGVAVVRFGEFYTSRTDGMHAEINVPPGHPALRKLADRIRTARTLTKEIIMGVLDEKLPDGNHYTGNEETLGWAVREMEPRIVKQVALALEGLEKRLAAAISEVPKLAANELLARQLTATTWNGGDLVDRPTTVAALLTRASEGSIAAHLARGHKLVVATSVSSADRAAASTPVPGAA